MVGVPALLPSDGTRFYLDSQSFGISVVGVWTSHRVLQASFTIQGIRPQLKLLSLVKLKLVQAPSATIATKQSQPFLQMTTYRVIEA